MTNSTTNTFKLERAKQGFRRTSSLVHQITKKSLENRGFSQSKLITNWNEIVGLDLSKLTKPVRVTFPKGDLGATLTIEIDGAFGPEIDLQREIIKEKVNRVYGYRAVGKIKFKPSSFLGYEPTKSDNLFSTSNQESGVKNDIGFRDQALRDLIPKLEKITNKKLRKTLIALRSNFIKRLK